MNEEIIINSRPDELSKVERLVDILSKRLGVSDDVYGKILVSTIEAVNNAIVHGNRGKEERRVFISFLSNGSSFTISVRDEGEGYDYSQLPDPTAPENIEKLSGRGVFLMKKLADGIEFNEEGNEVKMVFKY